jgi:hypothetical protein
MQNCGILMFVFFVLVFLNCTIWSKGALNMYARTEYTYSNHASWFLAAYVHAQFWKSFVVTLSWKTCCMTIFFCVAFKKMLWNFLAWLQHPLQQYRNSYFFAMRVEFLLQKNGGSKSELKSGSDGLARQPIFPQIGSLTPSTTLFYSISYETSGMRNIRRVFALSCRAIHQPAGLKAT